MDKDFCLGIIIGMLGGALICSNSKKAREWVLKSQSKIQKKLESNKEFQDISVD